MNVFPDSFKQRIFGIHNKHQDKKNVNLWKKLFLELDRLASIKTRENNTNNLKCCLLTKVYGRENQWKMLKKRSGSGKIVQRNTRTKDIEYKKRLKGSEKRQQKMIQYICKVKKALKQFIQRFRCCLPFDLEEKRDPVIIFLLIFGIASKALENMDRNQLTRCNSCSTT